MPRPALLTFALAAAASVTTGGDAQTPARAPGGRMDLVVAATTDVHGRVRGWDYYTGLPDSARGLTRVATLVDSLRRAHPERVLLVDAGDLLQGNPLTLVAARERPAAPHPVIAAMNAMGYDAAAIGNHEFNFGLAAFRRAASQARFPFLAANARLPNGQRAWPAYRLVTRAGVRIGIVGATQPGAMIWDRSHLRGRLTIGDIVPAVRAAVAQARRAGAQVVIGVLHSGLDGDDSYGTAGAGLPAENVTARVAREVPGIDLIVYGHSHREAAGDTVGGALLMQPRQWATSLAVATLTLERSRGAWRVAAKSATTIPAAGRAEHPAVLAATRAAHEATLAYVSRSVGTTPVAWNADSGRVTDTPLVDFMLEAQRQRAGTELAVGAAYDLSAALDSGAITVAQVARLYPYENSLRAIRITGRQLREYLEHSARYYRALGSAESATSLVDPSVPGYNFDIVAGAEYTLDLRRPVGSRVTRLRARGRDVADTDTFTLAINNYRQSGGGGFAMIREAPVIYDRQEDIRELLIEAVGKAGTLRPEAYFTRNWALEPADAVSAAYAAMNRRATAASAGGSAMQSSPHLSRGRWLRILATNDFHGTLEPRRDANGVMRGGAAALATEIQRAKAECQLPACTSLLLDGGDEFQGTPASNLAFGRPVVDLFNHLGYAAAALGNHEFDWGQDSLRARMQGARYAILGANVRDAAGGDPAWVRNDTIVVTGGVRVGIIGLSTVFTPTTTRPSEVADLRFLAPAPVVDAHARSLRARGADLVVVVAHAGGFCSRSAQHPAGWACEGEIIDLAGAIRERVDAIVAGHTHAPMTTIVNGIPIIQARSHASALGVMDIPLDGTGSPVLALRDVLAQNAAPIVLVDSLVRTASEALGERFRAPVAQIAERIESGVDGLLGNLIADAQRAAGAGDVAVMNTGGVRAPLNAGLATYRELFEVHPFNNVLVRVTLRGRDLRSYLERLVGRERRNFHLSGVVVEFDNARAVGGRLVRVTMSDGRLLDDEGTYRLILSDFLAAGGDGLSVTERALSVEELWIPDLDALIAYLKAQPQPVRAPRDARLVPRAP